MQTYLEKRMSAKNVARFYRIMVLPNLFGEWTLYREWGRIGKGGKALEGRLAAIVSSRRPSGAPQPTAC